MGQLDGKVALITGASKGIGRVMSRLFAQEGAAVVCAARSRDLVAETAALIKADGGRALVSDTTLPGLGSLLERLSNELAYEPVADPRRGTEALLLRMSREA